MQNPYFLYWILPGTLCIIMIVAIVLQGRRHGGQNLTDSMRAQTENPISTLEPPLVQPDEIA